MALYYPTRWTSQPPGPQRIAAKWRSRIISAWYPNARCDVVRGNPLRINNAAAGWWSYRGDKLLGLGTVGDSTAYCDLGILATPGDATRISTLTIATPLAAYSLTRGALFDTAVSASVVGFLQAAGYTTKTKTFSYNAANYVAETGTNYFPDGERHVFGCVYTKTNPTNVVTYYRDGASFATGSFDTANNVAYGTNPYVIGGRVSSGGTNGWGGSIELNVLSPTALTAAEYRELTGPNVWASLFEPLWIRRYFFVATAAANVVTVTIAARTSSRGADSIAPIKIGSPVARASGLRSVDSVETTKTSAIASRAANVRAADTPQPIRVSTQIATGARLRAADGPSPTRSVTVESRAARIRAADQAAPTGITIVNVVARATAVRGSDAVIPARAIAIAARAALARGEDSVSTTRTTAIAARGAGILGAAASIGIRNFSAASRAANVRGRSSAAPTGLATVVNIIARASVRAEVNAARRQPAGSRPGFRFGHGEFRPRGPRTRRPTFKE